MARNSRKIDKGTGAKLIHAIFQIPFFFLNQDIPENLRLNQMSFTVDSFSGDNQ